MSSSVQKTDFLRFNAYSIEDLIVRKLSQDSRFTDQIYEGSNLKVLIQIVSYMYQCLIYQLNNAASESMFKDTQLYENMVRLIKFLGYTPQGCQPTTIKLKITQSTEDNFPRGMFFDTGKTDKNGKSICFSTDEFIKGSQDAQRDVAVYNGLWKPYKTIFTASGNGNETFLLSEIKCDSENDEYMTNDMIRVLVKDGNGNWEEWEYDREGLFLTSKQRNDNEKTEYITLTNSSEPKFTLNVTEDHAFEIRFGDGIIGKRLEKDSQIFILYLDSNGPYGDIDVQQIDFSTVKFKLPSEITNIQDAKLKAEIYGCKEDQVEDIQDIESLDYTISLDTSDGTPVKQYVAQETVEDIRENAPLWFRTGYRLITRNDYETFFKKNSLVAENIFRSNIIDVKCMNNIEYVSKFYKWLYIMGLNRSTPDGKYYFNGDFFNRNNYYFIDPSDANNIYLWVQTEDIDYGMSNTQEWNDKANDILKNIKMTTTEINIVSPITVNFDICASSIDFAKDSYVTNSVFDENCDTVLEITIADNVSYVSNSLQNAVSQIILEEFSLKNLTLGHKVDPTSIVNKIYEINGVQNVRTVWRNQNANDGIVKAIDGISFASWTDPNILEDYEDMQIGNSSRTLEDFQFPSFAGEETLSKRITVIKKQMSTINTITF